MSHQPAVPLGLSPEDEHAWHCHMQLARQVQTPWLFSTLLVLVVLLVAAVLALGRRSSPPVAAEVLVPLDPASLEFRNHSSPFAPIR